MGSSKQSCACDHSADSGRSSVTTTRCRVAARGSLRELRKRLIAVQC